MCAPFSNKLMAFQQTTNPGTTSLPEVVYSIGYPGQVSGLSQNWNRYYDSRTGRYTQPDPLAWQEVGIGFLMPTSACKKTPARLARR